MSKRVQMILSFSVLVLGLWIHFLPVHAAELTVVVDSARIREEANPESTVIGSQVRGAVMESQDQVEGTDGFTWYKVINEGNNTGYIRADMVEVSGGSSNTSSAGGSKPSATNPTPIAEEERTITVASGVTVREGASTDHARVDGLEGDAVITVFGEATDSDGEKWYQMRCTVNGREITGYVRADLTAPAAGSGGSDVSGEDGDASGSDEAGEGTGGEGAEDGTGDSDVPGGGDSSGDSDISGGSETGEGNVDSVDSAGEDSGELQAASEHEYDLMIGNDNQYYLRDNTAENPESATIKLSDLLASYQNSQEVDALEDKQLNSQKIIIIILAVVIIILILIVTLLLFKLRDLYDDYDDEEEYETEKPRLPSGRDSRDNRDNRESRDNRENRIDKENWDRRERSNERTRRGERYTDKQPRPQGAADRQPRSVQSQSRRPVVSQGSGESERRRGPKPVAPELRAAERTDHPVGRPAQARRPQNFLNDDDEFEFEFLNMDDKDL